MAADESLTRLLRMIRMSSAQRELVFEAATSLATALGDEPLAAHIQAALAHEELARRVEALWQAKRGNRAEYVPEMPGLDQELDTELSSLYSLIEEQVKGRRVAQKTREMGAELLANLFPGGVVGITRQSYVDQARASRDLMAKLKGDYAAHAEYFGLTRKVAELDELVTEYADAVGRSPASMDAEAQKATQERAHRYLLEVMARVLGNTFDSDDPEHMEARGTVTKVLFEQMDKARALARARRRRKSDGSGGDAA